MLLPTIQNLSTQMLPQQLCRAACRCYSSVGSVVQKECLLPPEIVAAHDNACKIKKSFYIDPVTGYKVMTHYMHLKRGTCCGNECRHCAYDHVNVPNISDDQ